MPFEKGTLPLFFLKINGKIPDDCISLFQAKAAGKLDDVKDEAQIGWVSGRHLLERAIDDETSVIAGLIYLNLRISQRKIPSALLKAECRKEELDYMLANKSGFVPRKVRMQIKKDIEERRLPGMPPTISGMPFVIDRKNGIIYLSTSSVTRAELFQNLFYETVKAESLLLDFNSSAEFLLKEDVGNIRPVLFSSSADPKENLSGRDFLTWMWYHSETAQGEVKAGKVEYNCLVEGTFTFASSDDSEGSIETALRRGSPAKSAEAKAALAVGKKLKKAKLTIARGKEVWSASFNADTFGFSSLSLPEGENLDPISGFEERIRFINDFHSVIIEYQRLFISSIKAKTWKDEQKKIIRWAEEKESL
jgi:hypothetical protein